MWGCLSVQCWDVECLRTATGAATSWGASPHPWPRCCPTASRLSCSATAWPPQGSLLPGRSLAEGQALGFQEGWTPPRPCTPLLGPASYLLSSPQEPSQPLTRRDPASPLMGPPRVTSRQALSLQPSMQPEFPPSPGRPSSQDTRLGASTGTDLGCPILCAHVASMKLVLPTPHLCLQHYFLGSHPTPGTWPESF